MTPSRRPDLPGRGEAPRTRTYVIDRREGSTLVMIDDDERSADVEAARVPRTCRSEGAVLQVPLDDDGTPMWEEARRDRAEERRRIAEMTKRIKRLGQSDPGGDIVL